MRIITVDDSFTMRRIIKNTLEKIGYGNDILEAENGKKALDALSTEDVDIIIAD